MWVAIEATTLSSVFMVALHRGKKLNRKSAGNISLFVVSV